MKKKLKIALIWPIGFDSEYVVPIALGYLKSNLDKKKYDVRIFDCSLENKDSSSQELITFIQTFKPEIVGVSCWSHTYIEAYNVLKLAKKIDKNITTVIGGVHATSYADRTISCDFIDFLFRGESELSFKEFLIEYENKTYNWKKVLGLVYKGKNGEFHKNDMERAPDIDIINFPDYNSIELEKYFDNGYKWNTPVRRNAPIWITRGCPYRCTFCAAPELNGRPIRTHSVKYMMKWISYLYHEKKIRWFNVIDDNFTFNQRYAKEFCRAVIDLNLKGIGFGTPNGIRLQKGDLELWKMMKRAGWRTLNVAPESGSQRVLDIMKKDLDLSIVPGVINDIRKAGLKVQGYFILGYPGETKEDIMKTRDFILKCKFNFVFLNNFQTLPGTPVYDDLVKNGHILDGLLPQNFSDGARTYIPEKLINFNFSAFILKTYFLMMIRDPLNIFYIFQLFTPKMLIYKLFLNFKTMLNPKKIEAYIPSTIPTEKLKKNKVNTTV